MGRKLVQPILKSQELVLRHLWIKHGGPVAVSRLCGVGMQMPNNWRMRGRVPLKCCRRAAIALNESIWAFNYVELAALFSKEERPSWIEVVNSCNFDRGTRAEIIFLEAPRVYD